MSDGIIRCTCTNPLIIIYVNFVHVALYHHNPRATAAKQVVAQMCWKIHTLQCTRIRPEHEWTGRNQTRHIYWQRRARKLNVLEKLCHERATVGTGTTHTAEVAGGNTAGVAPMTGLSPTVIIRRRRCGGTYLEVPAPTPTSEGARDLSKTGDSGRPLAGLDDAVVGSSGAGTIDAGGSRNPC